MVRSFSFSDLQHAVELMDLAFCRCESALELIPLEVSQAGMLFGPRDFFPELLFFLSQ